MGLNGRLQEIEQGWEESGGKRRQVRHQILRTTVAIKRVSEKRSQTLARNLRISFPPKRSLLFKLAAVASSP
jgi:hypothetical protein